MKDSAWLTRAKGSPRSTEAQANFRLSRRKGEGQSLPCAFRSGRRPMDKIRAIIADDEPLARRGIRQMLEPYDDIDVIAEARNGRETVRALRELKPDLIFLDVQMPALDGFGVLETIGPKHMPAVIFITAHDE